MKVALLAFLSVQIAAAEPTRPNVLFILADDMKAALGCQGNILAKTPNLDRLAKSGVLFSKAYCQFPLCNPSRVSMLTGRYPKSTGVLGNRDEFRGAHPGWITLPQWFKQHGYVAASSGKIFHGGIDDPLSWTDSAMQDLKIEKRPKQTQWPQPGDETLSKDKRSDRRIVLEGNGDGHPENAVADRAIAFLRKQHEKPFFLACGFVQPHSPPTAPRVFYDKWRSEDFPLPQDFAPHPIVPEGFPQSSIRKTNADLFIGRDASEAEARQMIHAYHAAMSWSDWNAGRVLDELDRTGLSQNTIVVFWSDHGYQLGEKGKWSKAGSLFEAGARVPMIVRAPGISPAGARCERVVESIDLFPTLSALCGLPTPTGIEGRDLSPLLKEPNSAWEHPAFTIWSEDGKEATGISIRTEKWRYTEYPGDSAVLLDSANDPGETRNLVRDPAHAAVIKELSSKIAEFQGETR
ncbi:sulfatase [Luteolibacter sp. GHJ8]|uniref:Sulfatase n=1 Tax=Luteolibacter rhizosphaerae TaxID=2989719 RepID=A0ABT3G6F8_9BACT|nr:sulfatase [Luteolibacter rhizosphaerae]MCW1915426.1 sulfatase [Luteolibacter rhizosphaerae]